MDAIPLLKPMHALAFAQNKLRALQIEYVLGREDKSTRQPRCAPGGNHGRSRLPA